jgi:hypothetical protein
MAPKNKCRVLKKGVRENVMLNWLNRKGVLYTFFVGLSNVDGNEVEALKGMNPIMSA